MTVLTKALTEPVTRSVLFFRDYRGFSGGHLKIWDYFGHVATARGLTPKIFLTPSSILDAMNPWAHGAALLEPQWRPQDADLLFLGGMDWKAVPNDCPTPVVNLIQGVRHADPNDPRFQFLSRPALRICVSDEIHTAISATGRVRGDIVTIPNGIDVSHIACPARPATDVIVGALKAPELGANIAKALMQYGVSVELVSECLPRDEYLRTLARARIAVLLPTSVEGFFLPALEAMALGVLVVCPDCVGNRGFCLDGATFRPSYDYAQILDAAKRALSLGKTESDTMRRAAMSIAARYTIDNERRAFHQLLDSLEGSP